MTSGLTGALPAGSLAPSGRRNSLLAMPSMPESFCSLEVDLPEVPRPKESSPLERFLQNPFGTVTDVLWNGPSRLAKQFERMLTIDSAEKAEAVFQAAGTLANTVLGEQLVVLAAIRFPAAATKYIESIPREQANAAGTKEFIAYLQAHIDAAPVLRLMTSDQLVRGRFEPTDKQRELIAKTMQGVSTDAAMLIAERLLAVAPSEAGVLLKGALPLAAHPRSEAIFCAIAMFAPDSLTEEVLKGLKLPYAQALSDMRDAALTLRSIDKRLDLAAPPIDPGDADGAAALLERIASFDGSKLSDPILHRTVRLLQRRFPQGAAALGFRYPERFSTVEGLGMLAELAEFAPERALENSKFFAGSPHLVGKYVLADALVAVCLKDPKAAMLKFNELQKGPFGKDVRLCDRIETQLQVIGALAALGENENFQDPGRNKRFIESLEKLSPGARLAALRIVTKLAPHILLDHPELLSDPEILANGGAFAHRNPAIVLSSYEQHKSVELIHAAAFALGVDASWQPEVPSGKDRHPLDQFKLPDAVRKAAESRYALGLAMGKDVRTLRSAPEGVKDGAFALLSDPAVRMLPEIKTDDLRFPGPKGSFVPLSELPETERMAWTPRAILDLKLSIARNLVVAGSTVSRESVNAASRKLFEVAASLDCIAVVKDRDVYILANDEIWRDYLGTTGAPPWHGFWAETSLAEPRVFGGRGLRKALLNDGASSVTVITPRPSDVSQIVAKERFLESFAKAEVGSTFILTGHGSPEAFALTGGDVVNGRPTRGEAELQPGELADALLRRAEAQKKAKTPTATRDIMLIDACFSQDFLREVVERIRQRSDDPEVLSRLPVFAVASERGQYSFGAPTETGSHFLGTLFRRDGGRPVTLRDVRELVLPSSNPGLFFLEPPKKDAKPDLFQLGQSDIPGALRTAT